ncbi:MAG: MotA/TolQ/ExbB proton channel family protein [Bacteroidales bacterium]|nr:MotA/TolQ/ExbB proton channel family protein [Bacteroidales bacterium]
MIYTLFSFLAAQPQQQEMTESLFSMAAKGGYLMLVLLLLSVIAIYIFAKKCYVFAKECKHDPILVKDINDLVKEGKIEAALSRCQDADTPVSRMIAKGIEYRMRPAAEIQNAMDNVASAEVAGLEKSLPALSTISGGAPMIGFLGTVMGMIQAFFNMAKAGNNIDITLLSGGIYTAMITTVGGLVVGILAYFGYNYLTARISSIVADMSATTAEFLDNIKNIQEGK